MRIYKKVTKKNGFVPMDAAEQTLYNIFAAAFYKPTYESAIIPEAKSFSSLKTAELNSNGGQDDSQDFDIGDQNNASDEMLNNVQAELLLLNLLRKFTDRDKVIVLFQVVRDMGYHLTHEDCATTIGITRERYMVLLKSVKKRTAKILQIPAE